MRHASNTLAGKFFHTHKADGKIEWQGRIVREQGDGHYLVQLYSWLDGRPTNQKLVSVTDMAGWSLYDSQREWRLSSARETFADYGGDAPERIVAIEERLDRLDKDANRFFPYGGHRD